MSTLTKLRFPHCRVNLFLLSLAFLLPLERGNAQSIDAKDIVQRIGENSRWSDHFSAECRVHLNSSVFADMEANLHYAIQREQGGRQSLKGRVTYQDKEKGENYLFHDRTNKTGNLQVVLNPMQSDESGVLYEEQPETPDTCQMYVHVNGANRLSQVYRQMEYGGPQFGGLGGMTKQDLATLLASADLTLEAVAQDGPGLQILRGESAYGAVEVALSPAEGYVVKSLRLEKLAGKHLDFNDKPFSFSILDSPVVRETLEYHATEVAEIDGHFIAVGATFTNAMETESGHVESNMFSTTLENIDLDPDFSAPDAFSFSVPEGTRVSKILKDGHSVVSGLAWRDNRVEVDIKARLIDDVRATVAKQRPEDAPRVDFDPESIAHTTIPLETVSHFPAHVNGTMLRESAAVLLVGAAVLLSLVLYRKESGRDRKYSGKE